MWNDKDEDVEKKKAGKQGMWRRERNPLYCRNKSDNP